MEILYCFTSTIQAIRRCIISNIINSEEIVNAKSYKEAMRKSPSCCWKDSKFSKSLKILRNSLNTQMDVTGLFESMFQLSNSHDIKVIDNSKSYKKLHNHQYQEIHNLRHYSFPNRRYFDQSVWLRQGCSLLWI